MTPAQAYEAVDDTGDHLDKTHVPHLTAEQREQQQSLSFWEKAQFAAVVMGSFAAAAFIVKWLAERGPL